MLWTNFLLTYAIELPCYAAVTRKSLRSVAGFILLMNLASWPLATLLYGLYPEYIWGIEVLVVALEATLLVWVQRQPALRALALATLLNAASFGLGALLLHVRPFTWSE